MQAELSICTLKPIPYTPLLLGSLCFHIGFKTAAEAIGLLGGWRGTEVLVLCLAGKPYLYLGSTSY